MTAVERWDDPQVAADLDERRTEFAYRSLVEWETGALEDERDRAIAEGAF